MPPDTHDAGGPRRFRGANIRAKHVKRPVCFKVFACTADSQSAAALAWLEVLGREVTFIDLNAVDSSGLAVPPVHDGRVSGEETARSTASSAFSFAANAPTARRYKPGLSAALAPCSNRYSPIEPSDAGLPDEDTSA